MCLFFEKGMRAGVLFIFKRYSKANNKYLQSYDPKQESKHFTYLDANNLYGYGMPKFLSTDRFKWVHPEDFETVQKAMFSKLLLIILKNCIDFK